MLTLYEERQKVQPPLICTYARDETLRIIDYGALQLHCFSWCRTVFGKDCGEDYGKSTQSYN